MSTRGRLIAICGIDGSGKTLQADLLCERDRWQAAPTLHAWLREGALTGGGWVEVEG